MSNSRLYVAAVFIFLLIISSAYSQYQIYELKQELQLRPPILTMDIAAIAMQAAKDLKTTEERVAYVKKLEKITHDLSEKGYLVINGGNVLATPKENVITLEDIKKVEGD
ncbi:MAG: hypothetical protein EOO52_12800 [Gammaproteobacteria bacterium]|nr:MAG: hypothetical protein EOO52_12800 [Gammaproteobacteria bacterium]